MGKNVILWLSYFDCSIQRRLGRRVPLTLCVNNPKPNEFLEACKKLGLECEYVDKRFPRTWYKELGYIVIKNVSIKKTELIKFIAREVKGTVTSK